MELLKLTNAYLLLLPTKCLFLTRFIGVKMWTEIPSRFLIGFLI